MCNSGSSRKGCIEAGMIDTRRILAKRLLHNKNRQTRPSSFALLKEEIITHINKRPSAALLADLADQHFGLLV